MGDIDAEDDNAILDFGAWPAIMEIIDQRYVFDGVFLGILNVDLVQFSNRQFAIAKLHGLSWRNFSLRVERKLQTLRPERFGVETVGMFDDRHLWGEPVRGLLAAFRGHLATVLAEEGCIEYTPLVDTEGISSKIQTPIGADTLMVVERWSNVEALRAHAVAPATATFTARIDQLAVARVIHVLSPA